LLLGLEDGKEAMKKSSDLLVASPVRTPPLHHGFFLGGRPPHGTTRQEGRSGLGAGWALAGQSVVLYDLLDVII
jgi:hypothetical protein